MKGGKKTFSRVLNTNDLFNLKGKWDKQLIPVKLKGSESSSTLQSP